MSEAEQLRVAELIDKAVTKHLQGEPLTEFEQRIVAYTWTAGACPSCGGGSR